MARNKIVTVCPVCGEEGVSTYYFNNGECIGCEACVYKENAWGVEYGLYMESLNERAEMEIEDRKNGFD